MSWTKVDTSVEGVVMVAEGLTEPVIEATMEVAKKRSRPAKQLSSHDPVNHPAHYTAGGIETIDFIEAKELNYHLGNVIKYVSRAGKKGVALEDLEKAAWYLNREINRLKNQK